MLKCLYTQNVYARVVAVPNTSSCFLSPFANSSFYFKISLGCIWNSPNDRQESEPSAFLNVIISLWCLHHMGIFHPTQECREDLFLIRGLGKKIISWRKVYLEALAELLSPFDGTIRHIYQPWSLEVSVCSVVWDWLLKGLAHCRYSL